MTQATTKLPRTRLSRFEIIILAGLFILLTIVAFQGGPSGDTNGEVVYSIYQGDRLLLRFDATRPYGDFRIEGLPTVVFRYTEAGLNIIHNDCPDKFCLRQGPISRPGEQILCVPHKILCRVDAADSDIDIILGG